MKANPKTTKALIGGLAVFFCLICSFVYPSGAFAEEDEISLVSRASSSQGIQGTVKDSASLTPIASAFAELLNKSTGKLLASGYTDTNGYYFLSFKNKTLISVTIRCTKSGYQQFSKNGRMKFNKLYTLNVQLVDIAPPSGSITINNNNQYTNSSNVILNLSVSDNESGLSKALISNDNSTFSTYSYMPTINWTLVPGDGNKTVYVKFQDKKGLTSQVTSDNIVLDTTAPVVKITKPQDGSLFNKSPIEVVWTVDGVEYKDLNYSLTEGENTITKSSTDDAENTGSASVKVTLDTTAPTTTDSGIDSLWHNSPVTVTLTATDATSGPDKTYYSTDNTTPTIVYTSPFTISTEGTYTIKYYSLDKAGNPETTKTAANEVRLDKTTPTGSIEINNDGQYTNSTNVTLTLSAQDEQGGSGLDEMSFSDDNATWSAPEIYAVTKAWTLPSGDGAKTVYVEFSDVAGNWSDAVNNTIILDSSPPEITAVIPGDSSTFLAGAKVSIQINAHDADNDPLECQFSIGGSIKQSWSTSNAYIWQTSDSDTGSVDILCEVKDSNKGTKVSKIASYNIINPTVEEILQSVADNYDNIYDFEADMILSSTLNGQPFGETEFCRYYFKAPNKEKTESFSDSYRATKTEAIIIDGPNMYLVDTINKIIQQVDLLTEAGISSVQFSQMDIYYDQSSFLNNHTSARNNSKTDFNKMIIAIDAIPKVPNNLYSKLELYVDYNKGLLVKSCLYKENESRQMELIQTIEVIESQKISNGAWLPIKMVKNPHLTSGALISTLTYINPQINAGLTDLDFDPNRQY